MHKSKRGAIGVVFIVIILLVAVVGGGYYVYKKGGVQNMGNSIRVQQQPVSVFDESDWQSYKNDEYGLEMKFPNNIETFFSDLKPTNDKKYKTVSEQQILSTPQPNNSEFGGAVLLIGVSDPSLFQNTKVREFRPREKYTTNVMSGYISYYKLSQTGINIGFLSSSTVNNVYLSIHLQGVPEDQIDRDTQLIKQVINNIKQRKISQ